eukprot:8244667-Karenia_brevis.AAC.1
MDLQGAAMHFSIATAGHASPVSSYPCSETGHASPELFDQADEQKCAKVMEYFGVGSGVQNTTSASEQPLASLLVSQAAAARAAAAAAASTALLQGADAEQANEFIFAVRTA